MKNKIRKIVKETINNIFESGGKQDDLNKHSKELAELIVSFLGKYIEDNKDKLYDGYEWEFSRKEIIETDFFKKNTLIGGIKLNVNYIHSPENKISGVFKKTQLLDDGYYLVFLEINIKINDNIEKYFNEIEYWISHELHHAFRYIKTINRESKARFLNRAKNYTNEDAKALIRDNTEIKEFMNMFYLSLSPEVEARQQETAAQLKNIETHSSTETIEYLQQFQPINDARRMLNYSTQKVLMLDVNLLNTFIDIFNNNLKKLGLKNEIKKTPDIFFKYWEKIITSNGDTLLKKILRMVSDKHQLKEGLISLGIEECLLRDVFGSSFDSYSNF